MNHLCPSFFKPCLNGAVLKYIAIATMLIDHVGVLFFPQYKILRYIGRIAFPIFCFLLVEGVFKTSNIKKYALRLFALALISEIPFDLVAYREPWHIAKQNVFWTLLFGLLMLWILQSTSNNILLILGVFACGFMAYFFKTDYGMWGVALILAFYIATLTPQSGFILFLLLMIFKGGSEYYGIAGIIPIFLYNNERGKQGGHILYAVYPVHLTIYYIIWCLINGTSIFTF